MDRGLGQQALANLDTYQHVLPGMGAHAAATFAELILADDESR